MLQPPSCPPSAIHLPPSLHPRALDGLPVRVWRGARSVAGNMLTRRARSYHGVVQTKTREVHEQCDTLLKDKQQLSEVAESIRSKLSYFDELDRVSAVFSSGPSLPSNARLRKWRHQAESPLP